MMQLLPKITQIVNKIDPDCKVEEILKVSLKLIPSPSPSLKVQISEIMDGKVCLRCKSKTLLGVVNKLLKIKCLLTMPSFSFLLYFRVSFVKNFGRREIILKDIF